MVFEIPEGGARGGKMLCEKCNSEADPEICEVCGFVITVKNQKQDWWEENEDDECD